MLLHHIVIIYISVGVKTGKLLSIKLIMHDKNVRSDNEMYRTIYIYIYKYFSFNFEFNE